MKLKLASTHRSQQLPGDLCIYSRWDITLTSRCSLDVFVFANQDDATYTLLRSEKLLPRAGSGYEEVINYDD